MATKLATPLLDVLTITNEETANQIKTQMTANMPEQQKVYIQDKSIKEISNYKLSFSKFTFPHQLFRVVLLEQIYRSCKILNNETYHK